jgi:eukaryotic-like serine/threonine-protein kinase
MPPAAGRKIALMESAQADTLTGRLLDRRYQVRSRIAHGGMATVYLATDTRLDREVALKVMHADLARDADFVDRFIGEAKSVAKLSHPNIVGVYDQGADGQYLFLAMEYVHGQTLRAVLREHGWLPWQDALGVLDQILAGLAAAHQAGIVHRDVKPENVLITADGRVKVVDFGLARASAAAGNTRAGMIIGSVAYLAPEQVTGGVTDARTDVYAAGVMLFEMLTGRQPFTGETPLAVAYAHVNSDVPVVSTLVGGLPPTVVQLVQAATSRDPARRPANAGVFHRVTRVLRGYPEPADSVTGAWAAPATAGPYGGAGPYGRGTDVPGAGIGSSPGSRTMVVRDGTGYAGGTGARPGPLKSAFGGLLHGSSRDQGGGLPPGGTQPEREPFLQRWLFSRRLVYVAVGAVAVVALSGGGWYLASGRYATIPAVTGDPLRTAEQALSQAGFHVRTGTSVNNNSVPSGDVVSVSPSGRAAPGTLVTVTMSLGPRMIQVPAIPATDSVTAAMAALRAAGLTVSTSTKSVGVQSDPQIGTVAGTTPAAGTVWPQNNPVYVDVVEGLSLPNLTGQDINTIANQWAALNHVNIQQSQVNSNQATGIIVSQSPAPGTLVRQGQTVDVSVSNGPPMVPFPNMDGQNFNQVKQELEQLGFQVDGRHYFFGQQVTRTDPSGQAPAGSTITVYYGGF